MNLFYWNSVMFFLQLLVDSGDNQETNCVWTSEYIEYSWFDISQMDWLTVSHKDECLQICLLATSCGVVVDSILVPIPQCAFITAEKFESRQPPGLGPNRWVHIKDCPSDKTTSLELQLQTNSSITGSNRIQSEESAITPNGLLAERFSVTEITKGTTTPLFHVSTDAKPEISTSSNSAEQTAPSSTPDTSFGDNTVFDTAKQIDKSTSLPVTKSNTTKDTLSVSSTPPGTEVQERKAFTTASTSLSGTKFDSIENLVHEERGLPSFRFHDELVDKENPQSVSPNSLLRETFANRANLSIKTPSSVERTSVISTSFQNERNANKTLTTKRLPFPIMESSKQNTAIVTKELYSAINTWSSSDNRIDDTAHVTNTEGNARLAYGVAVSKETQNGNGVTSGRIVAVHSTVDWPSVATKTDRLDETQNGNGVTSGPIVSVHSTVDWPSLTTKGNTSDEPQNCWCLCDINKHPNNSLGWKIKFIAHILSNMEVSYSKLSSNRRKYISVTDDRPSSQVIGYTGMAICLLLVLFLILPDIVNFVRFLFKSFKYFKPDKGYVHQLQTVT